jgi:hypothetical protein
MNAKPSYFVFHYRAADRLPPLAKAGGLFIFVGSNLIGRFDERYKMIDALQLLVLP